MTHGCSFPFVHLYACTGEKLLPNIMKLLLDNEAQPGNSTHRSSVQPLDNNKKLVEKFTALLPCHLISETADFFLPHFYITHTFLIACFY